MRNLLILSAIALLGLLAGPQPAAAQSAYVVIVNDGNATRTVSRDDLSQIFLKRRTAFPSGMSAVPVDQAGASPVRETFSEAVHGRSTSAVQAYWQRQIFSGQGVPPVEESSDDAVISFVRGNINAVGYVSRGAALGDGVHAVQIVAR